MSGNEKFFMKILENEEFKNLIMEDMMNEVYAEVNGYKLLNIKSCQN